MNTRRVITRNERLAMDREDKITRAEVLSAISRQPRRKSLSNKAVAHIVELYDGGKGITNMAEIGRKVGVDSQKVRNVLLGKSYRHISGLRRRPKLQHVMDAWYVELTADEEPNVRTLNKQEINLMEVVRIYRSDIITIREIIHGKRIRITRSVLPDMIALHESGKSFKEISLKYEGRVPEIRRLVLNGWG